MTTAPTWLETTIGAATAVGTLAAAAAAVFTAHRAQRTSERATSALSAALLPRLQITSTASLTAPWRTTIILTIQEGGDLLDVTLTAAYGGHRSTAATAARLTPGPEGPDSELNTDIVFTDIEQPTDPGEYTVIVTGTDEQGLGVWELTQQGRGNVLASESWAPVFAPGSLRRRFLRLA